MIRRWLDKLPPKAGIWIVGLAAVVALGLLCFGAGVLISGGAPGAQDRYIFMFVCLAILQRFSNTNVLKPSTTKRIIDVLVLGALAVCVLWYVRTATPTPFGVSSIWWYAAAYALGWGAGSAIDRLRVKHTTSASD